MIKIKMQYNFPNFVLKKQGSLLEPEEMSQRRKNELQNQLSMEDSRTASPSPMRMSQMSIYLDIGTVTLKTSPHLWTLRRIFLSCLLSKVVRPGNPLRW